MIQPETVKGRKAYFRKRRETLNSLWWSDGAGTIHIPFSNGLVALIDSGDEAIARCFTWTIKVRQNTQYVESAVPEELTSRFGKNTSLHRVVLGATKGEMIDHRNHNGLDCRRSNLRFATYSQNSSNRHYKNKTGYRGVVARKAGFSAQIEFQGKNKNLGTYRTAQEAARAYNTAALEKFGEFAILNAVVQ